MKTETQKPALKRKKQIIFYNLNGVMRERILKTKIVSKGFCLLVNGSMCDL